MKLKYAKIETQNNLGKYDWHKRNIGEVQKCGSTLPMSGGLAGRDSASVPLRSQVDGDWQVLVLDRSNPATFSHWEDVLDFLVNKTLPEVLND